MKSNRPRAVAFLLAMMLAVVCCSFASYGAPPDPAQGPPEPGIAVRVIIADVYDGDTVTVTWTQTARVRLLDCWAPEVRTTDAGEKLAGEAARDFLHDLAAGKSGVLHIPTAGARRIDDVLTMGRVLGNIWLDGDPLSLSEHMRDAGLATKEKEPWQNVPQRSKESPPASERPKASPARPTPAKPHPKA